MSSKSLIFSAAGASTGGWDISTATYAASPINFLKTTFKESNPRGMVFHPDGTNVYVVGTSVDTVFQWTLSTAWDLSTASYLQGFSVSSQSGSPSGITFKPDGTKMYMTSGGSPASIFEYNLSTAWDISTSSYVQSFSVSAQETVPQNTTFKPDGTKFYTGGSQGRGIDEWSLSTPWDISTASWVQFFNTNITGGDRSPSGIAFKSDGTKMFISGSNGDVVVEFNLSTAWNISTASVVQSFYLGGLMSNPQDIYMNSDGTKFYFLNDGGTADYLADSVRFYPASTPYDVSSLSYTEPSTNWLITRTNAPTPTSLAFKDDGTKLYVMDPTNDSVVQYDLSTAWNVSSASYTQSFSVTSQDTTPLGLAFKPDGTKMYMMGSVNSSVFEYNLSTAWDISTASYVQSFSVSSQTTVVYGVTFGDSGSKMYVMDGATADRRVLEYTLSTPWNVSTASYNQAFSVSAAGENTRTTFFRSNGKTMFVTGRTDNVVFEYSLSTSWDISTSTFVQSIDIGQQTFQPGGIFFKPDGTIMFVVSEYFDEISVYNLE